MSQKRLTNFDFYRGVFILLAIYEHIHYFMQFWYKYYAYFYGLSQNSFHLSYVRKTLPLSDFGTVIAELIIPWATHVFIAMACFNLAKRTKVEFAKVYVQKLKIFALIFLAFLLEGMLISISFGEGLSIKPLHTWAILLMLTASIYRFFGVSGVAVLFLLNFTQFFLPVESWNDAFEQFIIQNVHFGFEYDAVINEYLASGTFGFLMGYIFFHQKLKEKLTTALWIGIGSGIVLFISWYIFGEDIEVNPFDFILVEHSMGTTALGQFGILGIILLSICGFLLLERNDLRIEIKPILWVGRNSLAIFILHQIVIVKIILPFRTLIGEWTNTPVYNSMLESVPYTILTVFLIYLLHRMKFFSLFKMNA